MEVLIFQKEVFEEMAEKFSRFSDRVNELLAKQGGKSLNRWMDSQEVCQQFVNNLYCRIFLVGLCV